MRLVVGEVAELHQQAVLRVELAVPWYQDRRKHWRGRKVKRKGRKISHLILRKERSKMPGHVF